jgi:hypothetical protein
MAAGLPGEDPCRCPLYGGPWRAQQRLYWTGSRLAKKDSIDVEVLFVAKFIH